MSASRNEITTRLLCGPDVWGWKSTTMAKLVSGDRTRGNAGTLLMSKLGSCGSAREMSVTVTSSPRL